MSFLLGIVLTHTRMLQTSKLTNLLLLYIEMITLTDDQLIKDI